jgi:hypothetical protein
VVTENIGLGNVFERLPGPYFFRQQMDILESDKSIEPAMKSVKQRSPGLVLPLEPIPYGGESATFQKFSCYGILQVGENPVNPSVSIGGNCRKEFA